MEGLGDRTLLPREHDFMHRDVLRLRLGLPLSLDLRRKRNASGNCCRSARR